MLIKLKNTRSVKRLSLKLLNLKSRKYMHSSLPWKGMCGPSLEEGKHTFRDKRLSLAAGQKLIKVMKHESVFNINPSSAYG
jgi:hypothetical protein